MRRIVAGALGTQMRVTLFPIPRDPIVAPFLAHLGMLPGAHLFVVDCLLVVQFFGPVRLLLMGEARIMGVGVNRVGPGAESRVPDDGVADNRMPDHRPDRRMDGRMCRNDGLLFRRVSLGRRRQRCQG